MMSALNFNVIQLDECGGTLLYNLPEAIETAEDHLRTAIICEIETPGDWREKPVRLWFNDKWYEVRALTPDGEI
jgi:hypothetical protein